MSEKARRRLRLQPQKGAEQRKACKQREDEQEASACMSKKRLHAGGRCEGRRRRGDLLLESEFRGKKSGGALESHIRHLAGGRGSARLTI